LLGVDPLTRSALAGVGCVHVLLERREFPVAAGIWVDAAAPLRDRDREVGALVGGVGKRRDLMGHDGVDDPVLAGGGSHVVPRAGPRWGDPHSRTPTMRPDAVRHAVAAADVSLRTSAAQDPRPTPPQYHGCAFPRSKRLGVRELDLLSGGHAKPWQKYPPQLHEWRMRLVAGVALPRVEVLCIARHALCR
jgi:hypothetical protein